MKAIVLAGGFGTRLRPLTDDLPKPMMKVINNPLVDFSARLLKKADVDDIYYSLFHKAELLKSFIQNRYPDSKFSIEQNPLGSAGATLLLSKNLNERFFVLSADAFCDIKLKLMLEHHIASNAIMTMAVKNIEYNGGLGVVQLNRDGYVESFIEKPQRNGTRELVNTGIYIFEPEIFNYIALDESVDFARDVFPRLLSAGEKIAAFSHLNYWRDCGTIQSLYSANMDALSRKINFKAFFGGFEGILNDADSMVSPNTAAVIQHKSARIFTNSGVFPFSVLGANCEIAPHAIVANAVVLENSNIEESAINCIALAEQRFPVSAPIYQSAKIGEFINL